MKRHALLLAIMAMLIAPMLHAQVSITWDADMPNAKIPSGVTLPGTDTLTDIDGAIKGTLTLDATTYDNSNKVTAFNAIGAAVKTTLDAGGFMGLDTSDMSHIVYVIKNIRRGWDNLEDDPGPTDQYLVAEDVFRVWYVLKYKRD